MQSNKRALDEPSSPNEVNCKRERVPDLVIQYLLCKGYSKTAMQLDQEYRGRSIFIFVLLYNIHNWHILSQKI